MHRVVIGPQAVGVPLEKPCIDERPHTGVNPPIIAAKSLRERADAARRRPVHMPEKLEALRAHHRRKRREIRERDVVFALSELAALGPMPGIDEALANRLKALPEME